MEGGEVAAYRGDYVGARAEARRELGGGEEVPVLRRGGVRQSREERREGRVVRFGERDVKGGGDRTRDARVRGGDRDGLRDDDAGLDTSGTREWHESDDDRGRERDSRREARGSEVHGASLENVWHVWRAAVQLSSVTTNPAAA